MTAVVDGSAFGGRSVCTLLAKPIETREYTNIRCIVLRYVSTYNNYIGMLSNIKINVFLAEHRKAEENGF